MAEPIMLLGGREGVLDMVQWSMAFVQHLSMRVPWRDRPWDAVVCDHVVGNTSCTLLSNIGAKRDDDYEIEHSGEPMDTLDFERLPCLSERATFMSPTGYTVTKTHPYEWNAALKGCIHPTKVQLPGYALEAVPFRWLNRDQFYNTVGVERVQEFSTAAEDAADAALRFEQSAWIMDGNNQQAVIRAFFESVRVGKSLVFIYIKHSPLQEVRTDRLLVGAARVTGVRLPPMWDQTGTPAFTSSMWETIVQHSLRPDMSDGILLPYQALIALMDAGVDVSEAIAWAPEGRNLEFSYVTEHLTHDGAIEALASLRAAAEGMLSLGVRVPESAFEWLTTQTERLWQLRGPTPGLVPVLERLGVEQARQVYEHVMTLGATNPWDVLTGWLDSSDEVPETLRGNIGRPVQRAWQVLTPPQRDAMVLLSAMDISSAQVENALNGGDAGETSLERLVVNPYDAANWTYADLAHIPYSTVDRALFPAEHVTWRPRIPDSVGLEGKLDRRRLEALVTEVAERAAGRGDTLVPFDDALDAVNNRMSDHRVEVSAAVLEGADVTGHPDAAEHVELSGSLASVRLADGSGAFKLSRLEAVAATIGDSLTAQLVRPRLGDLTDARAELDLSLDRNSDVSAGRDELEERARAEKAAGLAELYASPLSVLIGPAGTGKTTLLRALVEQPSVADGGVLLLAPTGKARVQLQQKVGRLAATLASHLVRSARYDADTGRYWMRAGEKRSSYGLVVIDEASMLTEEMLAATLDSFTNVKRLVLVGDPRQLPPIGAGRPFVDLVEKLRPQVFESSVHVAPGYVELRVPRRQLPDGGHGRRHDIELASWFGDSVGAADESVWGELTDRPDLPTVRHVTWAGRRPMDALLAVMAEELPLERHPDAAYAFAMTYGATLSGEYLNWDRGAGAQSEAWQVLSPTRSRAWGSTELNRHLKRTYRSRDTTLAQKTGRWNTAYPIGPELIVRGDKVMQCVNRKKKAYPATAEALNYIANGEIGVSIGRLVARDRRPKRSLSQEVEFSSQPGFSYSFWPTSGDDVDLELAWAITVHKSQGSEFGVTFVVLPRHAMVSRELLYTALTRQRDKVVILHDGDLADLRALANPSRSETASRLTDLFEPADPVMIDVGGRQRRYDRRLIHVAVDGTPMRSKNEVIIASILEGLVPGRWEYEKPFAGAGGREVFPDFTIFTPGGRTIYWEHAGMLDRPDYAQKWRDKQDWYAESGVLPEGGANGTLMWTDDRGGADAAAWKAQIEHLLAGDTQQRGSPSTGLRRRRTTR